MNVFSFSFYFLILWCTFSFFLAVFLTCPLVNYRRLFQFEGRCSLGVSGENATRRDYKVRVASRIVTQFNLRISRTANWLVIDSSPARIMNIQRSTFNLRHFLSITYPILILSVRTARFEAWPQNVNSTENQTRPDPVLECRTAKEEAEGWTLKLRLHLRNSPNRLPKSLTTHRRHQMHHYIQTATFSQTSITM